MAIGVQEINQEVTEKCRFVKMAGKLPSLSSPLWANSADDKVVFSLTFHANCQILFSGKNKKKYSNMSSAENFTQHAKL